MKILHPASLTQAAEMMAEGAVPVAGGTALQLQWSQGRARPAVMAEVGSLLPRGIRGLTIGAATPLEEIRRAGLPLLSEALRDVAAPGIRRMGTLGGQIGFGAGCLMPALLVLGAQLETTEGPRALAEYLAEPRGLILSVAIRPADRHGWRKTGLRAAFSPAILTSAFALKMKGSRISMAHLAVGGGPVPPRRLAGTEAWLAGQDPATLDPDALRARIEAEVQAPDCAFRSARYRRRIAANALAFGITGQLPAQPGRRTPIPARALPPQQTVLGRASGGERWQTRPDMPAKVRGQMPYLTDHRAPDMLVGRILRAAHPHAEILSIDTTEAEALAGVEAVVTHRDIPGLNAFGIVFQDQPALCADKVRHIGDMVAAVAARDAATAEAALALIRVAYRPLPLVTDMAAALAPGAAKVHAGGNLVSEVVLERGDAEAAFATAAHVVEATYTTPRQMHGFMETEGGWIAPEGDGLLVCVGGQHGARDRLQLSRILALPEAKIRVITSPIGGGFGGKDELTVQPALALLALKTGRPVRLQLSRAESTRAGIKRNPMTIRMRTACDGEGLLLAQEVALLADSGAYASLSPGVMETAMEHCAGPYVIPNIRTRGRLAYTNNGIGGAFRGFGCNQMTYAVECQIDRLAAKAGLDPAAMRRRNLRVPGSPGYLGQAVGPSERLHEMLDAAQASAIWAPFEVAPEEIPGTGMALTYQGTGLGTIPEDEARFALRLKDGKVQALCGLDEMGQGLVASLHAAVAERLGCARSDVEVIFGDTGAAPDSGSTTAARGGYVVWKGVSETAPGLSARLLGQAAQRLGHAVESLCIVPGGIGARGANAPAPLLRFADLGDVTAEEAHYAFPKSDYFKGNARFLFTYGATLARVAVNRITGAVRLVRLEFHSAAGPVIDMASYLGQMEGALIQGAGFTLSEDILMRDGQMVTKNFDTYAMPGVRDVPGEMHVTAHETLDPGDPFGPRGAGEIGFSSITPAIANAVADATGRWPATAPFPPEEILAMSEAESAA
ncbi:molybdopterin-dependent oxidoreductase [Pseudooceanicola sp. CBS1P-1]|uniref:Molybdopterin-dependent oxidoreductase n=1 Tax=Pseudooceanicola albus TaxID=2692189 RepID=A0A6L7G773_9RHOB|nr:MULTISPECIES: molybdopterin cofactor-binding domain-containing protein [Pseudooceanicola]MBT9385185.1 molybdopterin-dependent oxidoreductase [Pseudooceanicola endophyticus]MXN18523.1 molybdopterin-dependent oxidoreductase [Pseudooceanicola albus]